MRLPPNKTKIVATIGPASESVPILGRMIQAGMNVARLNFSHGDFTSHGRVIDNVREAARLVGRPVTIMADLSGPKMRIGSVSPEVVELKAGARFVLTTDDVAGDESRVSISFDRLPNVVRPGDRLFLNDGYVELEVVEVRGADVECVVTVGGEIRSRKGLNLPGIKLGMCAFTDYDRECLAFALAHGVEAVSQSFVDNAADVEAVRQAARGLGHQPFIIAKIERASALKNIDAILAAADGIMVARGDLGVEVPIERIAVVQKDLMRRAHQWAKPVITATQMLESMTAHRLPTRAEATDVSNAILDGTDCVMLSGESATGAYPVDAVQMLARIAAFVEPTQARRRTSELYHGIDRRVGVRPDQLVAVSVEACFDYAEPAALFVPTRSGASARRMAILRLPVWIVAVTSEPHTAADLAFSYGVTTVPGAEPDSWKDFARQWLRDNGITGTLAIATGGPSQRNSGANHHLELLVLEGEPG